MNKTKIQNESKKNRIDIGISTRMTYIKQKQPPPNAVIAKYSIKWIQNTFKNIFHQLHPIIVMTAALAAYCHLAPLTPYVLPELKANQPHQSTNSPMHALTGLPSGNGSKPSAYRPKRGPNINAEANADEPPKKHHNSLS